jgi:hypothetical protein
MTPNHAKAISAILIAVVFVAAFTGTMIYYNGELADRNSKIVSLNALIASQSEKIAVLNREVSEELNLSKPCVVGALGVSEVAADWEPYWRLYIEGTVGNLGNSTAYNAGLKVTAYSNLGGLAINMTIPLVNGCNYATNTKINSTLGSLGPTQLGNLAARTSVWVSVNIYHEGVAFNWTVTPVWTDAP